MKSAFEHVVDSLDIETVIVCKNKQESRRIALQIAFDMGLKDADLVFCEHFNNVARVRIRAKIFGPGDYYPWLFT